MNLDPKRQPQETYEQYRLRRAIANEQLKVYLRGRPVWLSSKLGTYQRIKGGAL